MHLAHLHRASVLTKALREKLSHLSENKWKASLLYPRANPRRAEGPSLAVSECLHRKVDLSARRGGTARGGGRWDGAAAAWLASGPGSPLTGCVTSEGHLNLPASVLSSVTVSASLGHVRED